MYVDVLFDVNEVLIELDVANARVRYAEWFDGVELMIVDVN